MTNYGHPGADLKFKNLEWFRMRRLMLEIVEEQEGGHIGVKNIAQVFKEWKTFFFQIRINYNKP